MTRVDSPSPASGAPRPWGPTVVRLVLVITAFLAIALLASKIEVMYHDLGIQVWRLTFYFRPAQHGCLAVVLALLAIAARRRAWLGSLMTIGLITYGIGASFAFFTPLLGLSSNRY